MHIYIYKFYELNELRPNIIHISSSYLFHPLVFWAIDWHWYQCILPFNVYSKLWSESYFLWPVLINLHQRKMGNCWGNRAVMSLVRIHPIDGSMVFTGEFLILKLMEWEYSWMRHNFQKIKWYFQFYLLVEHYGWKLPSPKKELKNVFLYVFKAENNPCFHSFQWWKYAFFQGWKQPLQSKVPNVDVCFQGCKQPLSS